MLIFTFFINGSHLFSEIQKTILDSGNYRLNCITTADHNFFPDAQIIAVKGNDVVKFDQNGNLSLIVSIPSNYSVFGIESYNGKFLFAHGGSPYSSRGLYSITQDGTVQVINNSTFDAIFGIRVAPSGFGTYQGDFFISEMGNSDVTRADFGAIDGVVQVTPDGVKTQFYHDNFPPFTLYNTNDLVFSPQNFGNFGNRLFVVDHNRYYPSIDYLHSILMISADQSAEIFFDLNGLGDTTTVRSIDFNPVTSKLLIASHSKIYKIGLDGSHELIDQDYIKITDIRFNKNGDLFVIDEGDYKLYKITFDDSNSHPVSNPYKTDHFEIEYDEQRMMDKKYQIVKGVDDKDGNEQYTFSYVKEMGALFEENFDIYKANGFEIVDIVPEIELKDPSLMPEVDGVLAEGYYDVGDNVIYIKDDFLMTENDFTNRIGVKGTVGHEYFHAIQYDLNKFPFDLGLPCRKFIIEGTATWAAQEILKTTNLTFSFFPTTSLKSSLAYEAGYFFSYVNHHYNIDRQDRDYEFIKKILKKNTCYWALNDVLTEYTEKDLETWFYQFAIANQVADLDSGEYSYSDWIEEKKTFPGIDSENIFSGQTKSFLPEIWKSNNVKFLEQYVLEQSKTYIYVTGFIPYTSDWTLIYRDKTEGEGTYKIVEKNISHDELKNGFAFDTKPSNNEYVLLNVMFESVFPADPLIGYKVTIINPLTQTTNLFDFIINLPTTNFVKGVDDQDQFVADINKLYYAIKNDMPTNGHLQSLLSHAKKNFVNTADYETFLEIIQPLIDHLD